MRCYNLVFTSSAIPPHFNLNVPVLHRMSGSQRALAKSMSAQNSLSIHATTKSVFENGSEPFCRWKTKIIISIEISSMDVTCDQRAIDTNLNYAEKHVIEKKP